MVASTRDLRLTTYFDASGKADDDARAYVVAGFGATVSDWLTFEAKWKPVLDRVGIPELHMADVNAKKKRGFQHITTDDYALLMTELHFLLRDCAAKSFARVIKKSDLLGLVAGGKHPFALAGVEIMKAAERWRCNRNRRKYGGHQLKVVFDGGEHGKGKLADAMESSGLPAPSFNSSIEVLQLQPADWLAWELSRLQMTHEVHQGHGGMKLVKVRGTIWHAFKHMPLDWKYYHQGTWINIFAPEAIRYDPYKHGPTP